MTVACLGARSPIMRKTQLVRAARREWVVHARKHKQREGEFSHVEAAIELIRKLRQLSRLVLRIHRVVRAANRAFDRAQHRTVYKDGDHLAPLPIYRDHHLCTCPGDARVRSYASIRASRASSLLRTYDRESGSTGCRRPSWSKAEEATCNSRKIFEVLAFSGVNSREFG